MGKPTGFLEFKREAAGKNSGAGKSKRLIMNLLKDIVM